VVAESRPFAQRKSLQIYDILWVGIGKQACLGNYTWGNLATGASCAAGRQLYLGQPGYWRGNNNQNNARAAYRNNNTPDNRNNNNGFRVVVLRRPTPHLFL